MTLLICTALLAGLGDWLDSRLNWPKPVGRGRRERL